MFHTITEKDILAKLKSEAPTDGSGIALGRWNVSGIFLRFANEYLTTFQFLPDYIVGFYTIEQPTITDGGLETLAELDLYQAANYLIKYYNEYTKSDYQIHDRLGDK